ncbi:hypothetical protein GEMRC1_005926 [Eukaryota sp. GEM-RC1]
MGMFRLPILFRFFRFFDTFPKTFIVFSSPPSGTQYGKISPESSHSSPKILVARVFDAHGKDCVSAVVAVPPTLTYDIASAIQKVNTSAQSFIVDSTLALACLYHYKNLHTLDRPRKVVLIDAGYSSIKCGVYSIDRSRIESCPPGSFEVFLGLRDFESVVYQMMEDQLSNLSPEDFCLAAFQNDGRQKYKALLKCRTSLQSLFLNSNAIIRFDDLTPDIDIKGEPFEIVIDQKLFFIYCEEAGLLGANSPRERICAILKQIVHQEPAEVVFVGGLSACRQFKKEFIGSLDNIPVCKTMNSFTDVSLGAGLVFTGREWPKVLLVFPSQYAIYNPRKSYKQYHVGHDDEADLKSKLTHNLRSCGFQVNLSEHHFKFALRLIRFCIPTFSLTIDSSAVFNFFKRIPDKFNTVHQLLAENTLAYDFLVSITDCPTSGPHAILLSRFFLLFFEIRIKSSNADDLLRQIYHDVNVNEHLSCTQRFQFSLALLALTCLPFGFSSFVCKIHDNAHVLKIWS